MQSKRHSFIETSAQIAIGAGIAWLANIYILPLWFDGIAISTGTAAEISVFYIALSMARSYVIRRIGNRWTK